MVAKLLLARILRGYRSMTPGRFHPFVMRVMKALTNNPNIPDSIWAATPNLLASFLALVAKFDVAFHEAIYGGALAVAARDLLQAQLIVYLDEIASALEMAAVRNPEILIATGFDLAKERRATSRKASSAATEGASAEQQGKNS